MFNKKSIPAQHVGRLENVIQNRLRDDFPYSEEQLVGFRDWIDSQLLLLEVQFSAFVTPQARRRSFGR